MVSHGKSWVILAVAALAMFFVNLGGARLFDEDEPKNAECAREMFVRGDWVVPTFNYELRTDKPIMLYWLMLTSLNFWGVSEFAVRFPSAVMACVSILAVYGIGSRLFNQKIGFWAGICLASSLMFVTSGRISTPDATLIAFITLSLCAFVYAIPKTKDGWADPSWNLNSEQVLSISRLQWIGIYSLMGLAVLTKGPVGFLLPCAIIGLFTMCRAQPPHSPEGLDWKKPIASLNELTNYFGAFIAPSRFFSALFAMRPHILFGVVALVALPWYVAVGIQTEGAWLQGFLGDHNVGRFSSAMEGHNGPVFYYVIAILIGFFPWSAFLPVSILLGGSSCRKEVKDHPAILFLLCWIGVYVVFFSIAQTKLPNYVLPCYPALALLTAWALVRWQEGELVLPQWAHQWGGISLMLTGVVIAIAFPILSVTLLPGAAIIGLAGLIPFAMGAGIEWGRRKETAQPVLPILAAGSFAFCLTALAGVAPWASQSQESAIIGTAVSEEAGQHTPFATFDYFAPNLPFYAERPVLRYHSAEEISAFWQENPEGIVCVRQDRLEELKLTPAKAEVIAEVPRFLRPQQVVLVKRRIPRSEVLAEEPAESLLR